MVILGIDPGIARVGWAVLENQKSPVRNASASVAGGKIKNQKFGCIETSAGLSVEKRLKFIYEKLIEIIKEHEPDVLAIEELFFNTNAKTAFIVGQARGVVLMAASQNNMAVAIYTPLQVKMAITGYGRAEKRQIGQMVKILLKLKEVPKPDDVSDALAVALTHAFTKNFPSIK